MTNTDFWEAILKNEGKLTENESLSERTEELLEFLRSPNPQLRDEFGYQILTEWILDGKYDDRQLRGFMDRWLGDLKTGLGEVGTDSVLIRSFAVLMLSILVYHDSKSPWLVDSDYQRVVDGTLDYFLAERDLRGYDSDKGWLHATAHTADVLKFLARNEKSEKATLQQILDSIAIKLTHPQRLIYVYGEDERLAATVLDVVKRELISEAEYSAWLDKLLTAKENFKPALILDEAGFGAIQNVQHFLQALYFTLAKHRAEVKDAGQLEYKVFEILKEF